MVLFFFYSIKWCLKMGKNDRLFCVSLRRLRKGKLPAPNSFAFSFISAAFVRSGVTGLITGPCVLDNLSGLKICLQHFICFLCQHAHFISILSMSVFLDWSMWDIQGILHKTLGIRNNAETSSFYLPPAISARLFLPHHSEYWVRLLFQIPLSWCVSHNRFKKESQ